MDCVTLITYQEVCSKFTSVFFWITQMLFLLYKKISFPLVAQMVRNLPVIQESQVQSLGWEDPLEEGMATHSCILA